MKSENWNFHDFAFSSEMRNFYDQYFYGVDLRIFSYMGLYDDLLRSTKKCLAALGLESSELALDHVNVTDCDELISISEATRKGLFQFHKKDYEIYDYAKRMNY